MGAWDYLMGNGAELIQYENREDIVLDSEVEPTIGHHKRSVSTLT